MKMFTPAQSYIRVATATPEVYIADVANNTKQIKKLYNQAVANDCSVVVFPELCITGYSLGDVVRQRTLLQQALDALLLLAALTKHTNTAMIVGLPYLHNNRLYNVAAFVANGAVQGLVTKTHLPNYGEFYEQRWYQSFNGTSTTTINNVPILFGQHILFEVGGALLGIEICEDLWATDQPSRQLTAGGAVIIVNPSASPELVGKAQYRHDLVRMTSASYRCVYVYSGADWTESTTDIVMGGHTLISENGQILAERPPFTANQRLTIADIDIDHIMHDRMQSTEQATTTVAEVVKTGISRQQTTLMRTIPKSYFLPPNESPQSRAARLESIIAIQSHGLARRLKASNSACVVLGLSGGLDSTLALLIAYRAAHILNKDPLTFVQTITLPGHASSTRTQSNAATLASALGVSNATIPIGDLTTMQLRAITHNNTQDVTYENTQARIRTNLLFNIANQKHGLVLGTGDLSELVLGWCTYGGDQLSNYNVNGSIPKTLVRDLVQYCSNHPEFAAAKKVLHAIISTPISPELTSQSSKGITQNTETLIGPYELHDFFLYHVLRFGDSSQKIHYLATLAFKDTYSNDAIHKWLTQFYERFAKNQFKRSAMPDGPKVGSVSVSPRGDWRMPSDMTNALWK